MLKEILISARPKQWSKNLFIFAAVLFTGNLGSPRLFLKSGLAFIIFCALSASVYIFNDITDKDTDSANPQKKARPIASGALKKWPAFSASALIAIAALCLSALLPISFKLSALSYLLLFTAYSLFLKRLVIIDAIVVSLGFALRLLAGGFAISVASTPWSLLMTFFLALFISFVKRKAEGDSRYSQKDTLDHIVIISAASVIISYTLFTFFSGKNVNLYMTIPFVLYGVFRYIYLAFEKNLGTDPATLFIRDKWLFFAILGWAAVSTGIIYAF